MKPIHWCALRIFGITCALLLVLGAYCTIAGDIRPGAGGFAAAYLSVVAVTVCGYVWVRIVPAC